MTEEKTTIVPEQSPVMQQIGMLNLRINDFMQQLNSTIKALLAENDALKKENAELKAKPKETQKPQ
jgi:regulator of replication initiation timing